MAHAATNFDLAAKGDKRTRASIFTVSSPRGNDNLCVSPYSIESALAMTFAGADGETRTEMAHRPAFAKRGQRSGRFASLRFSIRWKK